MNHDARTILLIEDNEDDVFIFQRVYKQAKLRNPVRIVRDGQAALEFLEETARAGSPDLPVVVLLDLKLPRRHGIDILETIRATPALADLSVVVLSSSAEPHDVMRARALRARAYLVKPPRPEWIRAALAAVGGNGNEITGDLLLDRRVARDAILATGNLSPSRD